jgi:exonuclease III
MNLNCDNFSSINNNDTVISTIDSHYVSNCASKSFNETSKPSIKHRYMRILSVNVQGIRDANHLDNLKINVINTRPDIITTQETWLRSQHTNKSVEIDNYKIFRCDRKSSKTDRDKGGGVAVYVNNSYKSKKVACIYSNTIGKIIVGVEFIVIEIITKFGKLLIVTIYRVNKCTNSDLTELINYINDISIKYDHVIITGDLNITVLTKKSQHC